MRADVWQRIHEAILRRLREHDQIMWDRTCIDAASVPAPAGGAATGRNPTDRGKLGSKHHLLLDERGLPLAARISSAQVCDSRFLIPLVEPIPAVKALAGRARKRPGKVHADRAYASRAHRAWLRSRGIAARIARYAVASRERLGRWLRAAHVTIPTRKNAKPWKTNRRSADARNDILHTTDRLAGQI